MTTCIRPAHANGGHLTFPFYYHMTHKDNIQGILCHGILSRNNVLLCDDISAVDISDAGAQRWRDREEPANHRVIHDYAPLYINPKNPMLYKLHSRQDEIVILKISAGVLQEGDHVFTDGNAASRETKFSLNSNIVNESIAALMAEYWTDYVDGKRRRCAELLIYPKVQPNYILSAICKSNDLADEVASKTKIKVEVDASKFFKKQKCQN